MKSICPPTPEYIRCPIESATIWPVRSISIAELIAVMRLNERMTCVSLVKSTERISTIGLSFANSYSRCVPSMNAVTILPRFRSLRLPVTTPASTRSTTVSVNISVWTPRSCLPISAAPTRPGCADPELERRAIRDEVGHVAADSPLHVPDLRHVVLVRRHGELDREVDVIDVDEALAERPRDGPIELDDHRLRGTDRGVHRLDARPERAEAVASGCRVHEDLIERKHPRLEQPGHVGQEDRHVVRAALLDRHARVRADEQRPVPEVPGHLRREMRPGALRSGGGPRSRR